MTACGPNPGGNTAPDGGSDLPAPVPITVTGKVLTYPGNVADTTATVFIPGNSRQAQTVDATGAFTISGVTPPYDVYVAHKDLGTAVIYKGLTRTTITVAGAVFQSPSFNSAGIGGTVTGQQTTSDTNYTKVAFRPSDASFSMGMDPANSSGSYGITASWYENTPTLQGTLFALQAKAKSATSVPTSYLAYGRRDNVTVQNKGQLSKQDITLSPVPSFAIAGSTTPPSGYSLSSVKMNMYPDASSKLQLFEDDSPPTGSFSYAVPQVPGANFSVELTAQSADKTASTTLTKTGVRAGTNNLSMVFQAPALPLQPAPETKDVTVNTKLSWSPFAGGVHSITIFPTSILGPTHYYVYILLNGTETTLPDLSPVGIPLPANTDLIWNIQGYAPVVSVDEMSDQFILGSLPGDFTSSSALSVFTTAAAP